MTSLLILRHNLKIALNKLLGKRGLVMLSTRAYNELKRTRAAAISKLVQAEQQGLKPGITGVVFSKDRALQIHTLLASYFELVTPPAPLFIIYNASTPAHAKAYEQVEKAFAKTPAKVTFVRETKKFREVLPEVLAKVQTRNLFYLVDDIVLIRKWDLRLAATVNPLEVTLCPRLSPHIRRSYTANVDIEVPAFRKAPESSKANGELFEFTWGEGTGEWNYPASVDGNVFSTAEMRVLTSIATFKAPNTYEGALMEFADIIGSRRAICYGESKILNLPLNRVQHEVANLAGNVSADELLEKYNAGYMLNTAPLRKHTPISPHEEHTLAFIKRK